MIPSVTITAPSSKSVSHRACLCAALAGGISTLRNVLESDDLARTAAVLEAMGAKVHRQGLGAYSVTGLDGRPQGGAPGAPADLDVWESGTTCRLITAIAAAGEGDFRLHGKPRMHERPIKPLAEALQSQGAVFQWENIPGNPPCIIHAHGLKGGEVAIDLEESSQYLSGLLLAAPMAREKSTITIYGEKAVSWPYISLTLHAMHDFGVDVEVQELRGEGWTFVDWRELNEVIPGKVRFIVPPMAYNSRDYVVEGDWSNASYFIGAGALGPGPVIIKGLRKDSLQGDRAMLDYMTAMGAAPRWDGNDLIMEPAALHGAELDMGHSPDIVPTVAMVAAFASSPTVISNVAHLRIKESDRLAAVAMELSRIGTDVDVLPDGLRITPKPVTQKALDKGVDCLTYGDHRLAMCTALFERKGITVRHDDPTVVAKSFPTFWDTWAPLRAQHEEPAA